MGIFSENRTQLNDAGLPKVSCERYDGNLGIASMIAETYAMDQAVFEAVMKRDVICIVAEAEGDEDKKESTDKNIFEKIADKVIAAIDFLKAKIAKLVETFYAKIDKWKKDRANKFINANKEAYLKKDLSGLKVSKFKPFNVDKIGDVGSTIVCASLSTCIDINKVKSATAEELGKDAYKKDNLKKQVWQKLGVDDFKGFKEKYNKELHNGVTEYVEYPFKSDKNLQKEVLRVIEGANKMNDDYVGAVKRNQKELNKFLDRQKKAAKDLKRSSKKAKSEDGVAQGKKAMELVSIMQDVSSKSLGLVMNATKKIISTYYGLFKKAVKYTPSESKDESVMIDDDYLDMVAETAEYEVENYLENTFVTEADIADMYDEEYDNFFNDTEYSFI